MEVIDFLKNKGITKATCYTDGGTYYVSELAKLMEEYSALRQPPVSGSASDFEKELYKLIKAYVCAGLKKPDLVHKMEYVTQSCQVS